MTDDDDRIVFRQPHFSPPADAVTASPPREEAPKKPPRGQCPTGRYNMMRRAFGAEMPGRQALPVPICHIRPAQGHDVAQDLQSGKLNQFLTIASSDLENSAAPLPLAEMIACPAPAKCCNCE